MSEEESKARIRSYTIAGILIVLFYLCAGHLPAIGKFFSEATQTLQPFNYGILIALVLTPLRRSLESGFLNRFELKPRTKRRLASLIVMLLFLGLLFVFFRTFIPQLLDSLKTFAGSINDYMDAAEKYIENWLSDNPDMVNTVETAFNELGNKISEWLTGAQGGIQKIFDYSISLMKTVTNFFIGIIIAIYLLLDEERFKRQLKQVTYAALPEKHADRIVHISQLLIQSFERFISGKALDSLIIGILCFVIISIMKIPYAVLISCFVGITNMIPVFGPFLGAIPSIMILLIIDPWKAVEFGIFILILQQVDGNIIGPAILGGAVGLPPLWVMFAIIVGGKVWGIPGMFIGVPLFSVIYTLAKDESAKVLKEKHLQV